jgi:hypothetical protein
MTSERLRYIRDLDSLAPLSNHTEFLQVNGQGKVEVSDRLPPPTDEYGIPRPEIMIEALLGAMRTENYVWTGRFDEHHLATPRADYSVARTEGEGSIGSAFRGLSCLKIDLPRQMHNFSHVLFELPGRPSLDVMRQAVIEVGYAKQLHVVIDEYFPYGTEKGSDRVRQLGRTAVEDIFDSMTEPEVGMLPNIESLASMEMEDLKRTVNSLMRVRRFSDKRLTHPAVRVSSGYRQPILRRIKTAA